jgi:hypothetical protein
VGTALEAYGMSGEGSVAPLSLRPPSLRSPSLPPSISRLLGLERAAAADAAGLKLDDGRGRAQEGCRA